MFTFLPPVVSNVLVTAGIEESYLRDSKCKFPVSRLMTISGDLLFL